MAKTVTVKFPRCEENWNTIIAETGDDEFIEQFYESSDMLIVMYKDESSWNSALNRFKGMIEYYVKGTPGYN